MCSCVCVQGRLVFPAAVSSAGSELLRLCCSEEARGVVPESSRAFSDANEAVAREWCMVLCLPADDAPTGTSEESLACESEEEETSVVRP